MLSFLMILMKISCVNVSFTHFVIYLTTIFSNSDIRSYLHFKIEVSKWEYTDCHALTLSLTAWACVPNYIFPLCILATSVMLNEYISRHCKMTIIMMAIMIMTISMGWVYASELRPPTGQMFISTLYTSMENHGETV